MTVIAKTIHCSRCNNTLGYRFDPEPTPPLYCIGCETAERKFREEEVAEAMESRKAMYRAQAAVR